MLLLFIATARPSNKFIDHELGKAMQSLVRQAYQSTAAMCPVIVSNKDESLTLVRSLYEDKCKETLLLPWDVVQSVDSKMSTFETRDCCLCDRSRRTSTARTAYLQMGARLNVTKSIAAGCVACNGDELGNELKSVKITVYVI
jgi:sugar/nucleoside kinase (ribokinase family)